MHVREWSGGTPERDEGTMQGRGPGSHPWGRGRSRQEGRRRSAGDVRQISRVEVRVSHFVDRVSSGLQHVA